MLIQLAPAYLQGVNGARHRTAGQPPRSLQPQTKLNAKRKRKAVTDCGAPFTLAGLIWMQNEYGITEADIDKSEMFNKE